MDYFRLHIKNIGDRFVPEVLIAQLAELGFESFEEGDDDLSAYIQKSDFDFDKILEVENFSLLNETGDIEKELIKSQNWNEVWESNYEPVTIGNCQIRASFHDVDPNAKYQIELNPKMTFGTAHHETTALMISYVLDNDFEGKTVLDMGSGTAVLAILAAMKGAKSGVAIDNDPNAFENAPENTELNNITNVEVVLGDAANLKDYKSFDIVFANINKNILLNDIKHYSKVMEPASRIFFSGFYQEDLKDIENECSKHGLAFVGKREKNNWLAAEFVKQ